MKISCDIIKDLLPLYVEELASEDTKQLVKTHVAQCSICGKELSGLRTQTRIPVDIDSEPLKQVERTIRKRKYWSVAAAVLLVVTLLTGIVMFLCVPVWLNAKEAIAYVEKVEDGRIKIQTTDVCHGFYGVGLDVNSGGEHQGIILSMQRIMVLFPPRIPVEMNDASKEGSYIFGHTIKNGEIERYAYDVNRYYMDYKNGSIEAVLWDAGHAVPDGSILAQNGFQNPNWVLQWLCAGATVMFIFLSTAWLFMRKRNVGKKFALASGFFGSYCISSFLVTCGRFMTLEYAELIMKLGCILTMTLLILITAICAVKAFRKNI